MKPLMFIPLAIFGIVAGLFLYGMTSGSGDDALPSTREGGLTPALTVSELTGGAPFTEADLRSGGVKLVNFWASWCAPCRAEHPQLLTLAEEGVPIYGINYKDEPAKALAFLDELGNPFARLAADGSGRTGLDWGLYGVPETFVINGEGVVIKRFAGPITEEILEKIIRPAIAEAAGE